MNTNSTKSSFLLSIAIEIEKHRSAKQIAQYKIMSEHIKSTNSKNGNSFLLFSVLIYCPVALFPINNRFMSLLIALINKKFIWNYNFYGIFDELNFCLWKFSFISASYVHKKDFHQKNPWRSLCSPSQQRQFHQKISKPYFYNKILNEVVT